MVAGEPLIHSANAVRRDGTSDTIVGGLVSVVSRPAVLALRVSGAGGDVSREVVAGIAGGRTRVVMFSLLREMSKNSHR